MVVFVGDGSYLRPPSVECVADEGWRYSIYKVTRARRSVAL
ncbi:hypothetical protein HMPREF3185_01470 [Porphyromonas somerae]|uniref:Uncharacterized protein n=1 Tax=Porphyromonas somerae TaxID=322095 RepID=A0A134B5E7_9PORP|nr:hypothetical protein HMPREF3184_01470 [Porphyromonadaceae bacterium KA00676]KXB75167.1 hypothetical protein HMPREF3185_01470 [Porphyromonas somerae]